MIDLISKQKMKNYLEIQKHSDRRAELVASIKFVQEQLDHGSVQITSDIYAHISKKLTA
ncbi:hypothetical protein PAXY110619_24120 [Paenibacillus xylanexedens]